MLQEAQALFFTPLRNKEHRRRQQAAAVFTVMWMLSILFTITTSFLLISVQALVLLNTAASLVACVVTQALCSRADSPQDYPFMFGFYRLSTVVRLGGIIFLVFGCLTTIVESLHRGMHIHHSNPYYLFCIGVLQLIFQIVYRREVRMVDRVTGHHGMAGAQSEDILHQACATASSESRSGAVGGGDFFKTALDAPSSASSPSGLRGSGGAAGSLGSRTVHNKLTTLAVYLLCPVTCMAVSVMMMVTDSALFDTVAALVLAGFYGYTGYGEGKVMLDLLMNKCVTDLRRNRGLERCLRNVKMLDGVLQVQSTVWWDINVSESMLLVRIRLMSGCDACAVSQAVRRQLVELATHVYVECFPANGTDGSMGDGSPISWGSSTGAHHGHSHDHHGHSHDHHHDDSSESVEGELGARPRNASTGALSGFGAGGSQTTLPPPSPGLAAPVSPFVAQPYGGGAGGGFSGRAAPMSFPAPPPSVATQGVGSLDAVRSGPHSPRSGTQGAGYSPYGNGGSNHNTNHGSLGNSRNTCSTFPAVPPSTASPSAFPPAPYSSYSPYGDSTNMSYANHSSAGYARQPNSPAGDTRYGQPALRSTAPGSNSGFPPPPPTSSSPQRSSNIPPPVFAPFRPSGEETKRNLSTTQEFV